MTSVTDIIAMTESDLQNRKNSITKLDLIKAVVYLRDQQHSAVNVDSSCEKFSTILDAKLTEKLAPVIDSLKAITEKQRSLEEKYDSLRTDLNNLKANSNYCNGMSDEDILQELEQRRSRECNVVISGLPEKLDGDVNERFCHDLQQFRKLSTAVGIDQLVVLETRRLGRSKGDGKRLLQVKLKSIHDRNIILKSSKALRSNPDYPSTYINRDLTIYQQKKRKELLSELRERRRNDEDVVIYRDRVTEKSSIQGFH